MTDHVFKFCGVKLVARASGCLWMPESRTLCASDLHLGKSGRIARRTGAILPPYETLDTLQRLADEIATTDPTTVICLGDSFDDLGAVAELSADAAAQMAQLQAGRQWVWIEGNHDPGPIEVGGTHMAEIRIENLLFRHIATATKGEVSGHYHPKFGVRGAGPARACFVYDQDRLILPAFGTFTGGLLATDQAIRSLFGPQPIAVLTGRNAVAVPIKETQRQQRTGGRF